MRVTITVAVILIFGALAGSAQTGHYLYTGSNQTITLNPGTYNIRAYGAQGGWNNYDYSQGGLGAEMEGQFHFDAPTTLTVMVGGVGGAQGAGGGGGTFVVNGSTPLVVAGGGGGAGYYINGDPGLTGTSGGGGNGGTGGNGGAGGGGGPGNYNSGGGGGFYSDGGIGPDGASNAPGGRSFLNGGAGGGAGATGGGFGGGGGGMIAAGGGGGGYSGGGGASANGGGGGPGGGGGSYIDSSAIAVITEISGVPSPNDALGNGEVIITTGAGPFLTNFVVSPTNPGIPPGASQTFIATGYFSDGSVSPLGATNGLVWSSSNQGVATVNSNGVATALNSGTTTITAIDYGLSRTMTLSVLFPAAGHHIFLFAGSRQTVTLAPGLYDITAYGAQGGQGDNGAPGGLGAQMGAEFRFTTPTTLTLLVGGAGASVSGGGAGGGGGGGGSFVANGTIVLVTAGGGGGAPAGYGYGGNGDTNANSSGSGGNGGEGAGGGGSIGDGGNGNNAGGGTSFLNGGVGGVGGWNGGNGGLGGGGGGSFTGGGGGGGFSGGAGGGGYGGGGGGGSYIDSSALANLAEISGIVSPDDPANGEIIITPVITMTSASIASGNFEFGMTGPANVTVVVQTCTNLINPIWTPLATNILSNGTNYFSDAQWMNYPYRFYRVSAP